MNVRLPEDWYLRNDGEVFDPPMDYGQNPLKFSLKFNHSGSFTFTPGRRYKKRTVTYVDMVDADEFSVPEVTNLLVYVMKILKENAGALTNFEVLDFLRSRGAAKDPTRVLAPVAPSEFKVYDYLVHSPASTQTRESINEFATKCKAYKLTKSDIANIVNIRPSSSPEMNPLIENSDSGLAESIEELVELVVEVFPPSTEETEESKSDE